MSMKGEGNMEKLSNAQQIKRLYEEVLSDCVEHSRIELISYAQQKSGNKYTDGMLTGALRTLVTDGEDYICVRRGWYKKKSPKDMEQDSNTLIEAYVGILQEALKKCQNITSDPFHVLRMSAEERKHMADIEKCILMISEIVDNIS